MSYHYIAKKGKRKIQGLPQSQPQPFQDTKRKREKTDKTKQAQIEQKLHVK